MKKLLKTLAVALLISISHANSQFSTFSEACDDDWIKCNPEADLKCINSQCKCKYPDDMAFETDTTKCAMVVGRNCTPPDGLDANCVSNAYCNAGHRCECLSHTHYDSSDGLCLPKKKVGQECTTDKECEIDMYFTCIKGLCGHGNASYGQACGDNIICDARAGLSCSNSSCHCTNPDTMIYSEKDSKCLVLVGKICYEDDKKLGDCVPYAYCKLNHPTGLTGHCACEPFNFFENSDGFCTNKRNLGEKCTNDIQCIGFLQLACGNGTCVHSTGASYGDPCGSDVRCDPRPWSQLSCINNSCQCNQETIYDNSKGGCSVPEGSFCGLFEYGCVANAKCDVGSGFVCKCEDPNMFYGSMEGLCIPRRELGQNCTGNGHCRRDRHLSCVGGVCSCIQSEAVINPAENRCDGKVGISCTSGGNCVENAHCAENKCQCRGGFHEADEGHCGVGAGASCGEERLCSKQLNCVEGKCECLFPLHQSYNSSIDRCVSYVEGPCFEDSNGEFQTFLCVPNAECKRSSGFLHECLCAEGYIDGPDRTCVGRFGQNCTGTGGCDILAGLKCRNGHCACSQFHQYDPEVGECQAEGMVGAVCNMSNGGLQQCVDGANCHSIKNNVGDKMKGICRCQDQSKTTSNRTCS